MKIINLIKCEFIKNFTVKKCLLILIVLLISCISVCEFQKAYNLSSSEVEDQTLTLEKEYEFAKNRKYDSEFEKRFYLKNIESQKLENELIISIPNHEKLNYHDFQMVAAHNIYLSNMVLFALEEYISDSTVNLSTIGKFSYELNQYVSPIPDMTKEEAIIYRDSLKSHLDRTVAIVKENKYYKYIEYAHELGDHNEISLLNHFRYLEDKYYKIIKDNKIEDEKDYRVKNIYQRIEYATNSFASKKVDKITSQEAKKVASILDYSIENNIKHDLSSNAAVDIPYYTSYITSKTCVNQILSLSIIVMLLIILTSGDIISKEHSKKTEKMLLTSPNKRWKILLSKFIYLILHMYIIWFIALFILIIYAGINYGFEDLLTPKLIYSNNSVIEVNYILYTIKQILYASIPVIAFISLMFVISTITLNTTITIGISTTCVMLSPFIWHFIQLLKLKLVAYTPIPYFMFSNVINFNENYLKSMALFDITDSTGVIISIITIIICYVVSNFIYVKRDIKN